MSEQKSETFEAREKDWSARVQCSGVARLANDLYAMLDERDAQNYIELRFESPKGGAPIIVTIHRPGGKTPHEFRLEAEAEAARLRAELDAIRSLPAVPPAAERRNCLRLRIDKDDTMGVTIWHGTARVWMDGDSLSGEEWASTDLASVVRWIRAQTDQFAAAYRAAPPTNETPSALAVPTSAPTAVGGAAERLARAADRYEAAESALDFASDGPWEQRRIAENERNAAHLAWRDALAAYRAAPPASTGAAPPAAEPAIFQKPGSSLDEEAVRGNNPEPAAEPAPQCAACGDAADVLCAVCGVKAKEPAPCGTCGGSGNVGSPCPDGARFIDGVRVSCAVMHSRPCPSCRPGGAA